MIKQAIIKMVNAAGYNISPIADMDSLFMGIYQECSDFTVTSIERMYALYNAIRYIATSKITGSIVECGVWRGGSMMLSALTLRLIGETHRKIYLYDTYSGMTYPGFRDINYKGEHALDKWNKTGGNYYNKWCKIPLKQVRQNMHSVDYPQENIIFVEGAVEDTLPDKVPDEIALLRLDTDWHDSTYHELQHLFPRLSMGGVLIVDDYGHFEGSRVATDRYIKENNVNILLHRIDYTGRIGIKTTNHKQQ